MTLSTEESCLSTRISARGPNFAGAFLQGKQAYLIRLSVGNGNLDDFVATTYRDEIFVSALVSPRISSRT